MLMSGRVELRNAFPLIALHIENLRTSTLQAINNFTLQKGDLGVFEVQIWL